MGKDLAPLSASPIRKSRDGEGYQEGSKSSAFGRCKPHGPPPFCALGRYQGKNEHQNRNIEEERYNSQSRVLVWARVK